MRALWSLPLLALAGCVAPANPPVLAGHHQLTVSVPAYHLAGALAHAWVASDIYEYRVVVQQQDGSGNPVGTALSATLPQKGSSTSTSVNFTGLSAGYDYKVSLQAWGNNGGSAAGSQLNTQTPSSQVIHYASNDADDSVQSVSLSAKLDTVVNNVVAGPAAITFGSPAPGGFASTGTATVAVPSATAYVPPTSTAQTLAITNYAGTPLMTPDLVDLKLDEKFNITFDNGTTGMYIYLAFPKGSDYLLYSGDLEGGFSGPNNSYSNLTLADMASYLTMSAGDLPAGTVIKVLGGTTVGGDNPDPLGTITVGAPD